jgi:chromosome segregation ATPase
MTVDPYETEDTSDWLGCPTPLETCQHQLRMYENEFEELTLQLRQARERIFKLVEMHAEAANERDTLRSQLAAAKAETAVARRLATEIETRSNWQLMAKDKHISELTAKLHT